MRRNLDLAFSHHTSFIATYLLNFRHEFRNDPRAPYWLNSRRCRIGLYKKTIPRAPRAWALGFGLPEHAMRDRGKGWGRKREGKKISGKREKKEICCWLVETETIFEVSFLCSTSRYDAKQGERQLLKIYLGLIM